MLFIVCLVSVILLYENSFLLVFIRDRGDCEWMVCGEVFLLCGMWKGEEVWKSKQKL